MITKATYRDNDEGYEEPGRPSHIWTIQVPAILTTALKAKQITTGEFDENDPVWSRDGSTLYFHSDRVREPYYQSPDSDLYMVSASGGDLTKIASIDGQIGGLALSPDGTRMAFVGAINAGEGVVERSYSQPDLFVTNLEPGSTPKNLTTKFDFDIGDSVGGDQAPPRANGGSKPYWSRDGRFIFVLASEEGRANLKRINAETGEVQALTEGNHNVFSYSATPDGAKVGLMISTPTKIGDLYVLESSSGQMKQITQLNADLFSKVKLTEPEMIWYKSFRRKADSSVGPEAAGFRGRQEVSNDFRHSWRSAYGLRLHLRPRVSVDGRQRLCGAVSESAREHELWPGVWQYHPVSISRRRLQRSDGGSG